MVLAVSVFVSSHTICLTRYSPMRAFYGCISCSMMECAMRVYQFAHPLNLLPVRLVPTAIMSNFLIPQSLCRRVASIPIVAGRIQSRAAHSKSKRFAPIKRKNESARQPAPRADPAPSLASAAAPSVPIANPIAGPSSYAGENQANLPTRQFSSCLWSLTS